MTKVCANGPTTMGIDIYHGDMITDINKVKAAGVQYVFLKAFEFSADPRFGFRWPAMRAAGILRGAYDFFHPSKDPTAQANKFLSVVGRIEHDDLPCALDWESTDGMPTAKDRENALVWLNIVEAWTRKTPIIYAGPYFLDALRLDERFAKYPLWIAHYGVKCPLTPAPWKSWTFWQGSESARIAGMSGPCDLDVFNGTLDELKKFVGA